MKKLSYIFGLLVLALVANGEIRGYDDYDYDEEYDELCFGSDNCAMYTSMDESCACHHRQFPSETLEQRFGGNVQKCCDFHGYRYHLQDCEVHGKHLNEKEVCQAPNSSPPKLYDPIDCPKNCRMYRLIDEEFEVQNGNLIINETKGLQNLDQHNYCVSYECLDLDLERWGVKASVCLCPSQDELKKINNTVTSAIRRCCGSSPRFNKNCETDTLDIVHHKGERCDPVISFKVNGSKIKFDDEEIPVDSTDICVGPTLKETGLKMTLFNCIPPCNGLVPCIRTCSSGPNPIVKKELQTFVEGSSFDTKSNLDVAHKLERKCAKGYKQHSVKFECNNLSLKPNDRNEYYLLYNYNQYPPDSFCLDSRENETDLMAQLCMKQSRKDRFEFYPYLLLTSSFFLFLTLIVYTFWSKLLTHYTRIMRHYTLSLFLAFIILAINQFHTLKDFNLGLCIASGFFIQYFFLVSFTLMTAISFELWKNLSGSQKNERRYNFEVGCGYGIPFFISLLTIIVEFSADKCFPLKPRFGDEKCFFAGELAKGIWLYLPIGIMLLINFVMFIFIVIYICALDKRQREFNLTSGKRNEMAERMNRFLLFLKLFFGMGFIWTFDIISGLIGDDVVAEHHWYFTDCLNMLQGVYIFVIFVCKRNVFKVIFKRDIIFSKSSKESGGFPLQIRNLRSANKNSSTAKGSDTLHTNLINGQSTA